MKISKFLVALAIISALITGLSACEFGASGDAGGSASGQASGQ